MRNEAVIRGEPGEYRISARYSDDGSFSVFGETVHPITLTVRVEDVWCRIPKSVRRYVYQAKVWIDGDASPSHVLEDVAPDARIFLDFRSAFRIEFS